MVTDYLPAIDWSHWLHDPTGWLLVSAWANVGLLGLLFYEATARRNERDISEREVTFLKGSRDQWSSMLLETINCLGKKQPDQQRDPKGRFLPRAKRKGA